MNRILAFATAVSLVSLLSACVAGGNSGTTDSAFQHIAIADNGDVVVHAIDGGDARITAAGDLDVRGKNVAVTPAQRGLLQAYHADALALRKNAVATGKAGMDTGMHAIDAVAKGLASGNASSIDSEVNSRAKKVDALAREVCQDLARLYEDQGAIANAIPAFGPYATIEPHEITDCHVD
jgi:hypothetical protein